MLERFKLIQDNVVKDYVQQAINAGYWIYRDKRWFTPEEFAEQYLTEKIHLRDDWMNEYKIMNPRRGLEAADFLVKQIQDRRTKFEHKLLDYYMNKTT